MEINLAYFLLLDIEEFSTKMDWIAILRKLNDRQRAFIFILQDYFARIFVNFSGFFILIITILSIGSNYCNFCVGSYNVMHRILSGKECFKFFCDIIIASISYDQILG